MSHFYICLQNKKYIYDQSKVYKPEKPRGGERHSSSSITELWGGDSPDVAVVDVEGQTDDAEEDAEAGEDGHGCKQLLRQEAVLLDHHRAIGGRTSTWGERRRHRQPLLTGTGAEAVDDVRASLMEDRTVRKT